MPESTQTTATQTASPMTGRELAEIIAGALDTMAFLCPNLIETTPAPASPVEAILISIRFGESPRDVLELVTGFGFGALLAGNLLGTSPDDYAARNYAFDSLKEVMNVSCGELLRRRADVDMPNMGLPVAGDFDAAKWPAFIAGAFDGGPVALLEVEGHVLAFRVGGPE